MSLYIYHTHIHTHTHHPHHTHTHHTFLHAHHITHTFNIHTHTTNHPTRHARHVHSLIPPQVAADGGGEQGERRCDGKCRVAPDGGYGGYAKGSAGGWVCLSTPYIQHTPTHIHTQSHHTHTHIHSHTNTHTHTPPFIRRTAGGVCWAPECTRRSR